MDAQRRQRRRARPDRGRLPPDVGVRRGGNFTRARSGHCYFTLRDADAQLRAVMWRDEARRLPTQPSEGMEVRALGRVTIYPARGEFQLVVSELEGKGEGLWKLAFDRLRVKLETEGLTAPVAQASDPGAPGVRGRGHVVRRARRCETWCR
jgi:exonuclease VII large subunit